MEKRYKFILENKSTVDQEWQLYPHDPVKIKPNNYIYYNYIIDSERNVSIGLIVEAEEDQIATAVRREAGEDTKFYLFPAMNDIAISTHTVTVHIRSTFEGNERAYAFIDNVLTSNLNIDTFIKNSEGEAQTIELSQMEVIKRVNYIQGLKLDFSFLKSDLFLELKVEDENKAGYVDSGSLISFVTGIKGLQKNDVLNSTLLAQLGANTAFDRWKDTVNWYKKYVEVLENVGWVIERFNFTEYEAQSASFTLDKVVLQILKAIATGDQMDVINETISALEALSNDDGKLVLFDTNGSNLKNGNFQIANAFSDGENVAMSMGSFYFSSNQSATRFLWFEFKKIDTHVFKSSQKVVLDEQIYSMVRNAIVKKLGDAAIQYVENLNIGF